MKLIIAGSRDLWPRGLVDAAILLFKIPLKDIEAVVSGCARGVDQSAIAWAEMKGIDIVPFPAEWDKHGKSAGYIRNKEMAKYGDELLAIRDGHSKGTLNMITEMQKLGKPVHIMEVYLK